MRRLWMSFFVGSAITAAGAAVAGGLPETGSAAGATAGSTDQAAAPAATAAAATATTTSTAASGQTATAAANTSSSQSTEVASSASPDEGGVETGSFIAIEDDPLIIDASSVVDGDGVGSMQVQWQISEDGLIYTFQIDPLAKWSNGTPVTSDDFAFSIRRILSPALGAPYAYMLYPVRGAEAYNK